MKTNTLAILFIGTLTIFTVGITTLALTMSQEAQVEKKSNIQITTNKSIHDWGTININDGKVSTIFDIKNTGNETVQLYNLTTSCTCTTAKLTIGDTSSPTYSMHTKSEYILEIPANQTAQLEVTYDPAFHGPSGVGQITRSVTLETNSQIQPTITFTLTANVIK